MTSVTASSREHPAEARLGVDIYDAAIAAVAIRKSVSDETNKARDLVGTGSEDVDEALNGGLEKGTRGLVNICGEGDSGRELLLSIIANTLINDTSSGIAVLDTSGTFPLLSLYELTLARIRKRHHGATDEHGAHQPRLEDPEVEAEKALERVRIMRVFDLIGIREAITEVVADLQAVNSKPFGEKDAPKEQKIARNAVIADSQDDDDDDMLLDCAPTVEGVGPTEDVADLDTSRGHIQSDAIKLRTDMIVIDNFTQLLNPVMKTNFIQAQALMTTFLRSLSSLTKLHGLLTLVLTSANPAHLSSAASEPKENTHDQQSQQSRPAPPSIFASNRLIPSLGQSFPCLMSVVLLVLKLPKTQRDAKQFYGGSSKASVGNQVRMCAVVEVLHDRDAGRVGRWGILK